MGLPGKRLSRSSKRRRASHFALKKQSFVVCPKCEKKVLPHRACTNCGTYKGREAFNLKKLKLAARSAETVAESKS